MKTLAHKFFLLLLPAFFLSCEEQKQFDVQLKEGAYYSIVNSEDSFGVLKIIAMDDKGFFVQFYSNTFYDRPTRIKISDLRPSALKGVSFSQYKAMERPDFFALVPIYITDGVVTAKEFFMYERWRSRSGGNWAIQ